MVVGRVCVTLIGGEGSLFSDVLVGKSINAYLPPDSLMDIIIIKNTSPSIFTIVAL